MQPHHGGRHPLRHHAHPETLCPGCRYRRTAVAVRPAGEDTASRKDPSAFFKVSRGVAYWQNENGSDKRLFYSAGAITYAINAADGKPIRSFGNNGHIDLTEGLGREKNFNPYIAATTPGVIYKNLLIMGGRVAESVDAAPGHIRAFDVLTGERKWIFHTIPIPGKPGMTLAG